MEEYVSRPRVIKCDRCQRFGHIERLCRSRVPKCGRCGETTHQTFETEKCNAKAVEDYKCTHCQEAHMTGDKDCTIMQQKLEELYTRYRYGM